MGLSIHKPPIAQWKSNSTGNQKVTGLTLGGELHKCMRQCRINHSLNKIFNFFTNYIQGYNVCATHCSTSKSSPFLWPITLGKGSKDSFTIRGWQLWLKQWMSTLHALYFLKVFMVSSWVLKEFIRTRGTLQPYLLFKCCEEEKKVWLNAFGTVIVHQQLIMISLFNTATWSNVALFMWASNKW